MPQRILVVKPDGIGDMILASGFFRALRRGYPGAHITALVAAGRGHALMNECPHVDQVISAPGVGPALRLNLLRLGRAVFERRVDGGPPDIAVIPRWCVDWYGATAASYLSGAPVRVGFSERVHELKSRLNRGADRLLTSVVYSGGAKHEVDRHAELLDHMGIDSGDMSLEFWPRKISDFHQRLLQASLGNSAFGPPLIAIGIGASEQKKVWPLSRFIRLCRKLKEDRQARFVAMGSPSEMPMIEQLANALGENLIFSGAYPWAVVGAAFRKCSLFIGCDSAQKHVAAALGLPVVELSCHAASGQPDHRYSSLRFGAWGVPTAAVGPRAFRSPCADGCESPTQHCILDIHDSDVDRAIDRMFAQRTQLVHRHARGVSV